MTPRSDDAKRDEDGPSNDSGCGDVSAAVLAPISLRSGGEIPGRLCARIHRRIGYRADRRHGADLSCVIVHLAEGSPRP
jgi:hypothetical protein